MVKRCVRILALMMIADVVSAGGLFGNWQEFEVFDQEPLEARLSTFGEGPDPNALAVVLWSNGVANQLTAVTIPPPYDGTGVSSTLLDSGDTLFALGDICTAGGNVVVPYVKDFNIETARFNGNIWSTATVPGTAINSFTTADCAVSGDDFLISGQDFNQSEIEFFRSDNGGAGYTFYGRYSGGLGPFSGAVRDQTAIQGNVAFSLNQTNTGLVRATHFNPLSDPPVFTHTNIIDLPAPGGSFQFVKESAARVTKDGYILFSFNADGNARTARLPMDNPSDFTTLDLGAVSNAGSRLGFQGGGLVHIEGTQTDNVIWGDYYQVENGNTFDVDNNYPPSGIGGPVDGCLVTQSNGRKSVWLAPLSTGEGTALLHRDETDSQHIFADGFEPGDTSSWSSCQ